MTETPKRPEFFTPHSSTSPPCIPSGACSPENSTNDGCSRQTTRRLQPNLTRKSHQKSRAGCFTCKSRKIKCGEERPSCKNCVIKAITCSYPMNDCRKEQKIIKRANSIQSQSSLVAETFTLQDMHFFHHFITLAYPHLPLGNEEVWIKQIPQFAREHPYLMHAMLALGASHLGQDASDHSYENAALQHRTHAINGLKMALAKDDLVYGEADAILAVCYSLMFQSTYISDGMAEFLTLVRGCALATSKIRENGTETAFDISPHRHFDILKPRLRRLPMVNLLHVLAGLDGLKMVQPGLSTNAEQELCNALLAVLYGLQTSSQEGLLNFAKIYEVWYNIDNDEFQQLIDPTNVAAQLLFAYFVGIELLMVPLSAHAWSARSAGTSARTLSGLASWSAEIGRRIPTHLQHHLTWPQSIVTTAVTEFSGHQLTGPAVLMLDRNNRSSERRRSGVGEDQNRSRISA